MVSMANKNKKIVHCVTAMDKADPLKPYNGMKYSSKKGWIAIDGTTAARTKGHGLCCDSKNRIKTRNSKLGSAPMKYIRIQA
mmetsp:Transcript_1518/g.3249  ORF Transcript_1518/g.3249 Transcript_1518/m.3249 type:complete len:82 (-) Transcript_1518:145-390(-)